MSIKKIVWYYDKSGMHVDYYDVQYENNTWRRFKIKGEMLNKHFTFIMENKCEVVRRKDGRKSFDRYTV